MTPAALPHEIVLGTNFGLVISVDDGRTWTWSCEQPLNAFARSTRSAHRRPMACWPLGPGGDRLRRRRLQLVGGDRAGGRGGPARRVRGSDGRQPGLRGGAGLPATPAPSRKSGVPRTGGGRSTPSCTRPPPGDHVTGVEVARSAPQTITLTLTSGTAFTPEGRAVDRRRRPLDAARSQRQPSGKDVQHQPDRGRSHQPAEALPARRQHRPARSWPSAATAARPPRRRLSLSGGALTASRASTAATLIAAGVQGRQLAYRSKDGGATFQSCRRRSRCSRCRRGARRVRGDGHVNRADGHRNLGRRRHDLAAPDGLQRTSGPFRPA